MRSGSPPPALTGLHEGRTVAPRTISRELRGKCDRAEGVAGPNYRAVT